MRSLLPLSLPALLLLTTPLTTALGINCQGSTFCSPRYNPSLTERTDLIDEFWVALSYGASPLIPGGPIVRSDLYMAGQHIACLDAYDGGICLFMEGNVPKGGVRGSVIIERLWDLKMHKCRWCGGVPISGDNDPGEMGVLKSDWVRVANCPTGVCKLV